MDGPLYLHVGLKKTGTSYLQSIFRASADELKRQDLTLVPRHEPAGHRLALAVLGRKTAGDPLAALPRQLATAPGGRCLITQELLGRADDEQIARLRPALAQRDVHVVVTVRDIARTIPSAWQQYVKAGHTHRYHEFLEAVLSGRRDGMAGSFWLDHGVVDVVERWGRLTTPSATHVVVVPTTGAESGLLLDRFCTAVGIEPGGLVRADAKSNRSLALAQVELLRRLNEDRGSYAPRVTGKVYKREFAHGVLGAQPGPRPLMPTTSKPWCDDYTEWVVEALTAGGYDMVGDHADLRPPDSAFTDDPQVVSDAELGSAAIAALRVLLDERAAQVTRARAARGR
jgi:hypothetical protein